MMCMVDYGEPVDVYRAETRRTRKYRRCHECGAVITPGDRYEACRMLYEGAWSSFASCAACVDGPMAWLRAECGGVCHGGVQEDLEEHWDERHDLSVSVIGLGRLIVEMRRRRGGARVA